MPQGKDRDSFDPLSQNLAGEDSTWMVDRLEIPRIIDCFFIIIYDGIALASQRENQIVVSFIYLKVPS